MRGGGLLGRITLSANGIEEASLPVSSTRSVGALHPLHAVLLAFPIAFSCAAVASDITYLNSAVMQWSNFSAWLIAGTALFSGAVLVWAIVQFISSRGSGRRGRTLTYLVLIALVLALSVFNSLHHARDAWASVSTLGLVLTIMTALLTLAAAWIGHSAHPREMRS